MAKIKKLRERQVKAEFPGAELDVHVSAPVYTAGSTPPSPPSLEYETVATVGRRKHRATGKRKGRPSKQDGALADSVCHVAAAFKIDEAGAVRKVAEVVARTSNLSQKAARARVRKAVRDAGR